MDGVMHPSVEQAIGRDRIRNALRRYENNPADEHDRGIVRAVNSDGSYEVLLDGDVQTARCAPYAKAVVGDRVIVVTTKDGENVLLGRLGGELGGDGSTVVTYDDASNYIAGRVFAYAGTDEPIGALLCDGRAVSRTTYWELFDAIGTTYGAGDGSSTFNLPNIESRTIIGESDSYALGSTGGEEKHTLTVDEMPSHTHDAYSRNYEVQGASGTDIAGNAYSEIGTWGVQPTGGSQPHNNMQPYIVMRYFITTGKGDPISGINPADYVVEWGETDGWAWRKYASGFFEASKNQDVALSAEATGIFGASSFARVEIPLPFTAAKIASANVSGDAYVAGTLIASSWCTSTIFGCYAFSTEAASALTKANISVHVTGFWKDSPASGGTETIAPTIEERFEKLETDYIVAEGTSGFWTWQKWASGIAKCWGNITKAVGTAVSAGNYTSVSVDLPFAFASREGTFFSKTSPAWKIANLYDLSGGSLTSVTPCFWLTSNQSLSASEEVGCDIYVTGRWK